MCTLEKHGNLFLLTLTGDDQHRLTPTLIHSLLSTLYQISSQATPSSVLITTAHSSRFSSGFDLSWAQAAGSQSAARDRLHYMVQSFKPVVATLLSLPMPTIAAVSGHAVAAGFLLAISHDYVLMSDKGVMRMPEVDLGLNLPDYFAAMVRSKMGSSLAALRDVLLRGVRVRAGKAVEMGIVDSAHDSAESTVEAAKRLGEELARRKWNGEVYAELRKSLYPELCGVLGLDHKVIVSKI